MMKFYGTILIASLLGSLHCASMCGPFAAFALMRDRKRGPWLLQAMYHGGRLFAYAILGAMAGAFGATLNFGGSLLGIGRVAGVITGALLVALGTRRILAIFGLRVPAFPGSMQVSRLVGRLQQAAMRGEPVVRSLGTGLCTALLPCGWLYAFVAMAAGSGRATSGAFLMLVFWTGTVPILAGIGAGVRELLTRTGRALQIATAVLVMALGFVSIAGRWNIALAQVQGGNTGQSGQGNPSAPPEHPPCHH
ncbi:MAG TPA: sulfite exporter TauE/SafE family protein [Polyangia bacterium]